MRKPIPCPRMHAGGSTTARDAMHSSSPNKVIAAYIVHMGQWLARQFKKETLAAVDQLVFSPVDHFHRLFLRSRIDVEHTDNHST